MQLLIQQSIFQPSLCQNTMLRYSWYSNLYVIILDNNLAYSYTTIDTASPYDPTIPLLQKRNSLYYYNWYSNLNDMTLMIQQPTILLHVTWYNNLYVMTLNTHQYTYTPVETATSMLWYLTQQPSILLYNNWFSKLPYDLMILLIQNLIHYYTTIDTATLMIWYSWYNNQLLHSTWLIQQPPICYGTW